MKATSILACAALALSACGDGDKLPDNTAEIRMGSLRTTGEDGLPYIIDGNLTLTGPGSYSETVDLGASDAPPVFTDLAPGTYSLLLTSWTIALDFPGVDIDFTDDATLLSPNPQTIQLAPGERETATLTIYIDPVGTAVFGVPTPVQDEGGIDVGIDVDTE